MELRGFAFELGGGGSEDVSVLVALFGSELEEAADGLDLAAEVAAAPALAAADTTEDPCEQQVGWGVLGVNGEMDTCTFGLRDEVEVDTAFAQQRVADAVEHLAGEVARDDLVGCEEPLRAGRATDADAQVAAVSGEVEGELGQIAGVYTEGVVGTVEGAVEELTAVADAECRANWLVAERAGGVAFEQRLECAGDDLWGGACVANSFGLCEGERAMPGGVCECG